MIRKIIFFLLFIFGTNLIFAESEMSEVCFNDLMSRNSIDVEYDEYIKSIDKSNYFPHSKPWDGLMFTNNVVYLKFYPFGQESSFRYEHNFVEQLRYGKLNWPNSHEYLFFEQYVKDPNKENYEFSGCGYINLEPRGEYTYNTLKGEDFWGCPHQESSQDFEVDENKIYKTHTVECYDYENERHSYFRVDRILYNKPEIYFNAYEVAKNHGEMKQRFYGENFNKFNSMYLRKVAHEEEDYVNHLRLGVIPIKWLFNEYQELSYIPLKLEIDRTDSVEVLYHELTIGNKTTFRDSYNNKVMIELEKDRFKDFFYGVSDIDSQFEISTYRDIEKTCGDKENLECIGKELTNKFLTMSDNIYSINFFVNVVMEAENEQYEFNNPLKIAYVFENEELIFGDFDYYHNEIPEEKLATLDDSVYEPFSTTVVSEEPIKTDWTIFILTFVVVFILIIISVVHHHRHKP